MKSHPLRVMAAGLALCALLGVPACQDDASRIEKRLEQARAYAEEEKHAEAVIEYKSALQLDPNLAEAHYGLAQTYIEQERLGQAYWELRETVRLDPEHLDARIQFGQLARVDGDLEEALAQAEAILEREPGHASALVLRAQALQGLQRTEAAEAAFREAYEQSPDSPAAVLLYANFLRARGDRAAAEPLYRELTELEPGFASWVAWAGFLSADPERQEEARAAYRQAVERAEDEEQSVAYRTLASFHYRHGRVEEAEAVLREAIEARPDDLQLIYLLARFLRAQGRVADADEMIESATRARPDDVEPQLILSLYRGRQGDRAGALAAAEKALEIDPENEAARLRKAELFVDQGQAEGRRELIAQARAIVDALLAGEADHAEALFVRAKIHLADGRIDEAVSDMRRVLELRESWGQAHLLLGSALFLRGDPLGARTELQRALEADAGLVQARKLLARVHAALGDDAAAVEEGRAVLGEDAEDDAARILVAQSLVRQRRLDEGRAELQRIPPERRDAEVLYAMGRIHRLQGNTEQARGHFERALDARPAHPDILRALLDLDQQAGDVTPSVERIEAALAERLDDPQLVHLSGLGALLAGDGPKAEAQLRRAIELEPNELRFYETLARYFQATGRVDEMVETYEQAVAARPDSAPLQLIIGTLYELRGDPDRAAEAYEAAIRLDPDLAPAKNNLAYLLAERGENLDRALDLAQEAKALLPDNPNAADTLGWVLYKKGIPSAAIGYLKEADEGFDVRNPSFGIVRHHLALAYEAEGRVEEARATLRSALEDLALQLAGLESPREPAWAADVRAMLQRLEEG